MADDVADGVAAFDSGAKLDKGVHLRLRVFLGAVVHQFDADGGGVAILDAVPKALAGVPGALGLVHKTVDRAVAVDDPVGADALWRIGVAQYAQGVFAGFRLSVVDNDHRDRKLPLVEIRRRIIYDFNHVEDTPGIYLPCSMSPFFFATM